MTLFRRNGFPLSFEFVGLDDDDLNDLTQLVERYGGKIVSDETLPIKFTRPAKFVSDVFPKFKLYDIEFIKECVKQSKIVDPSSYRIGRPMLYDDCVMSHYLKGSYDCCDTKKYIKIENIRSELQNRSLKVELHRLSQRSRLKRPARHSIAGTGLDRRIRSESSDQIMLLSPESTGSDTSDDEMVISVAKKRRGRGIEYTWAEETQMLRYIIEHNAISRAATSLAVWRDMINDGFVPNRTEGSLYCHFKKSILPKIEYYGLSAKHLKMFQGLKEAIE